MKRLPPTGLRFFHCDIYIPKELLDEIEGYYFRLRYTALAHSNASSAGLPVLTCVSALRDDIKEVVVDADGTIRSIAMRVPLGNRGDMFISFEPVFDRSYGTVKTTWLNRKGTARIIGRNYGDYQATPGVTIVPVSRPAVLPNPVFAGLEVAV